MLLAVFLWGPKVLIWCHNSSLWHCLQNMYISEWIKILAGILVKNVIFLCFLKVMKFSCMTRSSQNDLLSWLVSFPRIEWRILQLEGRRIFSRTHPEWACQYNLVYKSTIYQLKIARRIVLAGLKRVTPIHQRRVSRFEVSCFWLDIVGGVILC